MARQARVGGLRTSAREVSLGGTSDQSPKRFKYEFQSRADRLILSLEERTIYRRPNGSDREESPKTKMGNRLDMIMFENNYLGSNDPQLDAALRASPDCGIGKDFWPKEDMDKLQREARISELRRQLDADPDIKAAVLEPTTAPDFEMPAPTT